MTAEGPGLTIFGADVDVSGDGPDCHEKAAEKHPAGAAGFPKGQADMQLPQGQHVANTAPHNTALPLTTVTHPLTSTHIAKTPPFFFFK